ncbi:unnamed protein product [Mytilus coruscus]|uniref:Ubiquitin-like protease family profile domain-containing protein n=1 Tax=Mytilus coruscus TaxID=42192 RepID=A0A6J8BUM3_MYTCO|nr:unnamed protein product [Mytilus coruscus]
MPMYILNHLRALIMCTAKRALLTTPIPALPPAPTPKVSADTQVIEEWPALPEVCCLVSSLINTSHRLYASLPNRLHASTSNPSPAPIFNRSHDSISHRSSVSTGNRSPSSAPNSSPATTSNSSHAFISNSPSRILVGGGVTLYTVTEQLNHNDIVSILSNPETSCISDMPPAKPKANEVYLIRCENSDDWKCDQYPWIQYGLKKVTIGSAVLEKKYFKIKQPGSISEQSGKRSRPVGSLEFRRTAFYFEDKKNLVLVHYEGDENVYTPLTHGNRKERDNAPEYVRKAPSVLKAIEKVVQIGGKTAMDVYRDMFPKLNRKCVPFVTDREPGLSNAIEKNFPNCDIIMCWNHLIGDAKFNLQKMGADQTNIAFYLSNIRELLRCESDEEFKEKKQLLIVKWSKPFVTYFNKIEKDILYHCGKWIIITNNPCESMNAVIKRLNKYKELPVDCFVLSMYYLQCYYFTEIQRGLAGVGNYRLRPEFIHARIPKDEISIPKRVIKPDDIVKHVMSEIDSLRGECVKKDHEESENISESVPFESEEQSVNINSDATTEQCPTIQSNVPDSEHSVSSEDVPNVLISKDTNLSQKSLARLTVKNGNVTFVQQQKAFMVKGTQGTVYAVTLLPKETGQCPSTTQCYHIMAAKIFIGDESENKPKIMNLRMLSKRNLKRNDKKSGRKKPRPNDYDEVIPAPDSEIVEQSAPSVMPETPGRQSSTTETPKSRKKLKFKSKEQDTDSCATPKKGKILKFSVDTKEMKIISPPVSPTSTKSCQLPMKKRKVNTDVKNTSYTPWISSLNSEHKLMLENNSWLCSEIVNVSINMIAKQFPHISGFQPTGLSPIYDEDKQCWAESFGKFSSKDTPCVQVHHTGKSHWVTSIQPKKESAVYVLDSKSTEFKLTPSMEIQLSAIYGHGKRNLLVKLPDVQQQTNGYDCGVYAIANMMEYCDKGKFNTQRRTNFIEKYMRPHLISCLEKGHFTPFPQGITSSSDFVRIYARRIESNCQCGKPDVFENMIGCEAKRGRINCAKSGFIRHVQEF